MTNPETPPPPPKASESRWPRVLARGPLELIAMALIAIGVVMMCQPFSIAVFGSSFGFVLAGTVGFMIVSHFPE
ncbi:hypothetical protein [Amorphus orientalis]|uniref:Membrane protein n=1 Tax=Amorphus orientalis TaxID=649198 RepID=A0AAE3VNL4_9HYPH|nr:hypothetical protein [Amorphus orientalis]MDQ0315347.1 putative membrane protein [Amorphus orientalis]